MKPNEEMHIRKIVLTQFKQYLYQNGLLADDYSKEPFVKEINYELQNGLCETDNGQDEFVIQFDYSTHLNNGIMSYQCKFYNLTGTDSYLDTGTKHIWISGPDGDVYHCPICGISRCNDWDAYDTCEKWTIYIADKVKRDINKDGQYGDYFMVRQQWQEYFKKLSRHYNDDSLR